jgi:DnaK suppressor protein
MNTTATAHARPPTRALTRTQLREVEADLRTERARLARSLGVGTEDGDASAHAGRGGGARGTTSDSLAAAFKGRAHVRYEAILDALRRIEEGAYGRCADCGNPIPFGRLLVMPESTYCVACGPRA